MNSRKACSLAFVCVLVTTAVLADVPVEPGVTNEWSFDEGSGNTAADSVGGNDARLAGWAPGSNQWITGMYGGALDFNSASQYAITNSDVPATEGNQFSVSFWMRSDLHNPANATMLTPEGADWIGITNGKVSAGSVIGPDIGSFSNIWMDYTITYDRTTQTASIYQDGSLVTSGTTSLPALNTPWVFGHDGNLSATSGNFKGALDDVQFYNRILTTSEIQNLAAQPPQQGITAHLVTPAQTFNNAPVGIYSAASTSFYVDPSKTDWLAWNSYPQLRAVLDSQPGKMIGPFGVDDYFLLTIKNPLGQQMTVAMDQNGGFGAPFGPQAMILGTAGNPPLARIIQGV